MSWDPGEAHRIPGTIKYGKTKHKTQRSQHRTQRMTIGRTPYTLINCMLSIMYVAHHTDNSPRHRLLLLLLLHFIQETFLHAGRGFAVLAFGLFQQTIFILRF